ncbi:MAG: GNAT family N-acetyltransferase [Chloroflexota bacterium]
MTISRLRPARPDETALLTDIAMRSKAHYGYDAAFMAACRDDLTITPDLISHTTVIERDGVVCGFYVLRIDAVNHNAELDFLFVAPEHIGRGCGRDLWGHVVARLPAAGVRTLWIVADPAAVPFYERMGAQQVNTVLSSCVEGRTLPVMQFDVTES